WNPSTSGFVYSLVAGNGAVFAGFSSPPYFRTISETTGLTGAWPLAVGGSVRTILRRDGTIDLGGLFPTVAGQVRPDFAAFADPAFVPTLNVPERGPAAGVRLAQNRPNPFRSRTRIRFSLPEAGPVRLRLLDPSGRIAQSLFEGADLSAGEHEIEIDAGGL